MMMTTHRLWVFGHLVFTWEVEVDPALAAAIAALSNDDTTNYTPDHIVCSSDPPEHIIWGTEP